jgi:predicted 2-oxoglutarate/Fe(II)-dependent dioxygenase YbiX
MNLILKYDPFPFLEIENMYSEKELKLIWQELEFLNQFDKLEKPKETGNNEESKNNSGLFLDNLYKSRNISNILTVNKNLKDLYILEAFSSLCPSYDDIMHTVDDSTLISYYDNGGYYRPHEDYSLYTAITWFFKEPKKFSGGNFYFSDYNYRIELKNNKTILFPSKITHSVNKIKMNNKSDIGCGYGRYAMSRFFIHENWDYIDQGELNQ